jgi:hypothetical protein
VIAAGTYTFGFFLVQTVGGVVQPPATLTPATGNTAVTVVAGRAVAFSPPLFLTTTKFNVSIPQFYRVQLIDQYSNKLTYGGSQVSLNFLRSPFTCNPAVDTEATALFRPQSMVPPRQPALDNGDGTFNLTIYTTIAGSFVMNVSINGQAYLPCNAPPPQDTIGTRFVRTPVWLFWVVGNKPS